MRITKLAICCLMALGFGSAWAQKQTNHVELQAAASKAKIMAEAKKQEARVLASLFGIPMRQVLPNGSVIELMEFRRGLPVYYTTDNANAALSTRANRIWPGGGAGLALTGNGVMLHVWDGGSVRITHQEFGGRALLGDSAGLSDHATHVGGTMIASGVNAAAKGMSYNAQLKSFDWNSDVSEMATEAASGMIISNHSYGFITGWYWNGSAWYWYGDINLSTTEDVGFGYYDGNAQSWDEVAYNAPYYLICKSAGNDRNQGPAGGTSHFYWNGTAWVSSTDTRSLDGNSGYDSVSWHGVAKNIMTVAAVNDVVSYTGPASVGMSSFSGWGPTDDGRIKPDISANGVGLTSSVASSDTAYASFSGTSMSTPNTSGTLGLLAEHYRATHGATNMLSATLKALAIHTADEAGSFDGPDYAFGWGLLAAEAAAAVITEDVTRTTAIQELSLVNSETESIQVYSNGSGPLRVTIAWTDPAHAPATYVLDSPDLMLVNDLDLRVESPSSTTTMPWILDPANPANAATKGDNFRDNVEQVLIPTTEAGYYTITVTHKGASLAPSGSQAFSMIISGHSEAPVPAVLTGLTLSTSSVGGGTSLTGTVTMSNNNGGTLSLSSSSGAATVPASVDVPVGATSANFTINTTAVASTANVTITATKDAVVKNQALTVRAALLTGLSISPVSVTGGSTATGTVTVSGNIPAGGISINLSSNNANATVPATVTVPQGQTTANFTINTSVVTSSVSATISAVFDGTTKTANLGVVPNVELGSIALSPSTVYETQTSTGTVTLTAPALTGGFTVNFSVLGGGGVSAQASVVVPAGASSANFTVWAGNTGATQVTRTIRATAGSITKDATLTVNPMMVTNLTLVPTKVKGGVSATGTVTISAPAGSAGVLVNISDNSTFTGVPATVTVPAGATSVQFTITTSPVRRREYSTIFAARNGQSRSAILQLDKNASGGGLGG
jgi:hypothetical protein